MSESKYEELEQQEAEHEVGRLARWAMFTPIVAGAVATVFGGPAGAIAFVASGAHEIAAKNRRERERDGEE